MAFENRVWNRNSALFLSIFSLEETLNYTEPRKYRKHF